MPYRNAEDRRRYDRERRRRMRAGERAGVTALVPPDVRLRAARDLECLLAEAVALIRGDSQARGTEKARALAYLVSIGLRLLETRDLQERIEALERVLEIQASA
jgi:hypothetical protein